MGNNNQKNTNENGKREKLRIEIKNPSNFKDEQELGIKTLKSQQIADKYVNPMFKPLFKDYKGCMINIEEYPNGYRRVVVDLYFVKGIVSDAPYEALVPIASTKGTDTLSRIQHVSMMNNRNKIYQLTDEAKELLSDLCIIKNKNGEVLWDKTYTEIDSVTEIGVKQATGRVMRLDLNIILRKYYGYTSKDGSKQYFNVTPLRRLQNMTPIPGSPINNDWLLRIECLDEKATEESLKLLGNTGFVNGIPMYQA